MSEAGERDFGSASRFQAGAIGEPGNRTFYIYIEAGASTAWFLCEKGQVAALAERSLTMLNNLDRPIDEGEVERTVATAGETPWPTSPDDVVFRVGSAAIQVENDELIVVLHDVDGERIALFAVSREQLRAMALLALNTVMSGRPICPKCHLPEDPEGHDCPSTNGHRSHQR